MDVGELGHALAVLRYSSPLPSQLLGQPGASPSPSSANAIASIAEKG
jgi:hypothetical protein